jgi:hypothetical protein
VVLLLHQTPRSWREYEHVLPLLADTHEGVAMDTVGYGDTPAFADDAPTIERWADTALALMDALQRSGAVLLSLCRRGATRDARSPSGGRWRLTEPGWQPPNGLMAHASIVLPGG